MMDVGAMRRQHARDSESISLRPSGGMLAEEEDLITNLVGMSFARKPQGG